VRMIAEMRERNYQTVMIEIVRGDVGQISDLSRGPFTNRPALHLSCRRESYA